MKLSDITALSQEIENLKKERLYAFAIYFFEKIQELMSYSENKHAAFYFNGNNSFNQYHIMWLWLESPQDSIPDVNFNVLAFFTQTLDMPQGWLNFDLPLIKHFKNDQVFSIKTPMEEILQMYLPEYYYKRYLYEKLQTKLILKEDNILVKI